MLHYLNIYNLFLHMFKNVFNQCFFYLDLFLVFFCYIERYISNTKENMQCNNRDEISHCFQCYVLSWKTLIPLYLFLFLLLPYSKVFFLLNFCFSSTVIQYIFSKTLFSLFYSLSTWHSDVSTEMYLSFPKLNTEKIKKQKLINRC